MSKGQNFQSLKNSRGKITYFSLSLAVSHIKRKDLAWDIDSSSLKEVRKLSIRKSCIGARIKTTNLLWLHWLQKLFLQQRVLPYKCQAHSSAELCSRRKAPSLVEIESKKIYMILGKIFTITIHAKYFANKH